MGLENWQIGLIAAVIITVSSVFVYFNLLSNRRRRVARVYPFPHNPYNDATMMQQDMRDYTNTKHWRKHGYGGI